METEGGAPVSSRRRPGTRPGDAALEALDGERSGFYARTLLELLEAGLLHREMSVLVVCGSSVDRDVLQALGFTDVVITNIDEGVGDDAFEPYAWAREDAEALSYADESFDVALVSAGLHHCRSPHRALLEMYRVARNLVVALESRDSALMRLATAAGLGDEYELTAVAAHRFEAGGVRNSSIPNFVYRWTERDVEKTIAAYAPHARHRFLFFREFELPFSVVDLNRSALVRRLVRALHPLARGVVKLVPSQANLFAFAVVKPRLPRDLQPWLQLEDGEPVPNVDWIGSRYVGRR